MSKEKLLLVGAGGFGRVVAEQAMLQYDCAFVDDGQPIGSVICGIPVVGGIADLQELQKDYELLVVGIGNNNFRAQVYEKAAAMGYTFPNIIAPTAYVSHFAEIGKGCVILQNACIQNGAVVSDGVLLNAGAEVHCDAVVEDYALIYTNSVVRTGAKDAYYRYGVVLEHKGKVSISDMGIFTCISVSFKRKCHGV